MRLACAIPFPAHLGVNDPQSAIVDLAITESIAIPPVIWWNNLGRILLAVDDLACSDLLN